MSAIARALRISPQKMNENLNESGVFTRGYNIKAKTLKNSRWKELEGKPHEEIDFDTKQAIFTIQRAYEELGLLNNSQARDLMRQYNTAVNTIIKSSPISEKYKNELRAYNNFLEMHHLTRAFDPSRPRLSAAEKTSKLELWIDFFSTLTKGRPPRLPLRDTQGNLNREANEIVAMEMERARLNRAARFPIVPSTPVSLAAPTSAPKVGGKTKTRKHRRNSYKK
jgi:hypothetical protein